MLIHVKFSKCRPTVDQRRKFLQTEKENDRSRSRYANLPNSSSLLFLCYFIALLLKFGFIILLFFIDTGLKI